MEAMHGATAQQSYVLAGDGWVVEVHNHHYLTVRTRPEGEDCLAEALEQMLTPARMPRWTVSFGCVDEHGWDVWHLERDGRLVSGDHI